MFDIDLNLKNMPDHQWSLEIVLLTSLFFALAIGNFIYHAVTKKNWRQAVERSFFQGVALALAATV